MRNPIDFALKALLAGSMLVAPGVRGQLRNTPEQLKKIEEMPAYFQGKKALALLDMPAASDGLEVDVYSGPQARVWARNEPALMERVGIGVAAGETVTITKFVIHDKHLEIQLNGGGQSSSAAGILKTEPQGLVKKPGGSRINLRFEREIKIISDMESSLVELLLDQILEFDETQFAAKRATVKSAVVAAAPAPNVTTRNAPTVIPPFADFILATFKQNKDALNVAKFCAGHVYKRFSLVEQNAYQYVLQKQQLNQQYPTAIAEKRYQEALSLAEQGFMANRGPFYASGGALQLYLPPTATFQIIDVKAAKGDVLSGNYTNVFVQIEYPDAATAPYEKYLIDAVRNQFNPSGRRLRKTLLAIPTRSSLVVSEGGSTAAFAPLGPSIQRLKDVDLFW